MVVLRNISYENKVTLDFSRPGKLTDNAYIESFNGSLRDECLNVNWFLSPGGRQGESRGLAAGVQLLPTA
jgi:transposase InsO family protein